MQIIDSSFAKKKEKKKQIQKKEKEKEKEIMESVYYFGTVEYLDYDDNSFNKSSKNSKFFATEDELVCDIVSSGEMAKFMERVHGGDDLTDDVRDDLENLDDDDVEFTWECYFKKFPIKTKDELDVFFTRMTNKTFGDQEFIARFFKITDGTAATTKRKRDEEETNNSNKKTKDE